MTIEWVLWDHDGVLVDTEPWFFEATRRTLAARGVDVSREEWLSVQAHGRGILHFAARSARALDGAALRGERDELYARLLGEHDVLIDGALDVLRAVAGRCRMALVTTSRRRFVDQIHGTNGVLDVFDVIVSAEDCSRHKPDPEPYLVAMERLGADPARSVAIEDSPRGLAAARAAGVSCYVVRNAFMADRPFEGAAAVVDHLLELPAVLPLGTA